MRFLDAARRRFILFADFRRPGFATVARRDGSRITVRHIPTPLPFDRIVALDSEAFAEELFDLASKEKRPPVLMPATERRF